MPNTLAHNLRALALLYEWAETVIGGDLDETLERSELPTAQQLASLVSFLRSGGASLELNRLATVANQASAIRTFLLWTIDPANQGTRARRNISTLADQRAMLMELFRPLMRFSGKAERINPLSTDEVDRINNIFGPIRDDEGKVLLPLCFPDTNPFRTTTRLRNWLMMTIALQCGLRRGELLKIRLDDITRRGEPQLHVRRRADDTADTRRHKPSVKTVERGILITDEIRAGLSAYMTAPLPSGRPPGRTPYLFVTTAGLPLSITSADEIVRIVASHANLTQLSWHSFRHTWAELLAEDLLDKYPEEQALAFIRYPGGWTNSSITPMHYIQNALSRRANDFLVKRNMPRVKKRTEFRQIKIRPISLELGQLLEQLQSGDKHDRLFHWLNDLYPEHHIHVMMSDFVKQANIISPRTSQPLRLSPRRFRYTLGTEAAKEGASPASIAELLDHSDLQNVGVYVEASSYVVDQLGQKFDDLFEPIARRFRGQIVDSQTKSAFPGVPPKVIPSTSVHLPIVPMDLGGIGLCGRDVRKDGLCRLAPPLTCYPCEFFAAFRNGPHREVLEALERVRDELKKSSDLRIPMQLNDVVDAVKQLVLQIEHERKVADASAV